MKAIIKTVYGTTINTEIEIGQSPVAILKKIGGRSVGDCRVDCNRHHRACRVTKRRV